MTKFKHIGATLYYNNFDKNGQWQKCENRQITATNYQYRPELDSYKFLLISVPSLVTNKLSYKQ